MLVLVLVLILIKLRIMNDVVMYPPIPKRRFRRDLIVWVIVRFVRLAVYMDIWIYVDGLSDPRFKSQ